MPATERHKKRMSNQCRCSWKPDQNPINSSVLTALAGPGEPLPYEFKGYTLHQKEVKNAVTGKKQMIYFFAKGVSKSGTPCDLPKGRKAILGKNGVLPVLKKA
ncbi:MAG: hypothetical protein ACYDDF_00005 [Thermoplasmatota archaeon]